MDVARLRFAVDAAGFHTPHPVGFLAKGEQALCEVRPFR
jgi:hypothetical protein